VAVHLKGHFTVMRPATKHMRERRYGRIVTFTSTAGLRRAARASRLLSRRYRGPDALDGTRDGEVRRDVNCISPTAERG